MRERARAAGHFVDRVITLAPEYWQNTLELAGIGKRSVVFGALRPRHGNAARAKCFQPEHRVFGISHAGVHAGANGEVRDGDKRVHRVLIVILHEAEGCR